MAELIVGGGREACQKQARYKGCNNRGVTVHGPRKGIRRIASGSFGGRGSSRSYSGRSFFRSTGTPASRALPPHVPAGLKPLTPVGHGNHSQFSAGLSVGLYSTSLPSEEV